MEINGISKSINTHRLTSKKATLLGIGTRQYVKDVFYVNLSQNRRKVKVKGVYVDVINIYGMNWPRKRCRWADWLVSALQVQTWQRWRYMANGPKIFGTIFRLVGKPSQRNSNNSMIWTQLLVPCHI